MYLREYLFYNEISHRDFADLIDYAPGTITNLMSGRTKYNKKLAKAVERGTEGKIKAEDIMYTFEPTIEDIRLERWG